MVAGVCIEKSCPLGQTLNSQTGNCDAQCPGGKQLIGTTCYIIPSNCAGLTQALHCSGCVDPQKYKLVRGFCQPCTGSNPNFPCVSCPGSQIVSSSGGCISYNAFCSSVNSDNGQCSSFLSGYPPVNGFCCSSGLALSNGSCPSSTNPGQSGGSLSAEPGSGAEVRELRFLQPDSEQVHKLQIRLQLQRFHRRVRPHQLLIISSIYYQ